MLDFTPSTMKPWKPWCITVSRQRRSLQNLLSVRKTCRSTWFWARTLRMPRISQELALVSCPCGTRPILHWASAEFRSRVMTFSR